MAYMQVLFDVPPDIMEGINSGVLKLFGGVVRNAKGEIVYHLKDALEIGEQGQKAVQQAAQLAVKEPEAPGLLAKAGAFVAKHKAGVGIGIGLFIAAGVGIYKLVTSRNTAEDESAPLEIVEFNHALNAYLLAIKNGQLSPEVIDSLTTAIDKLKVLEDRGKIKIELTPEQIDAIVDIIGTYTKKAAEVNHYPLNDIEILPSAKSRGKLTFLQRNLAAQKQIILAA